MATRIVWTGKEPPSGGSRRGWQAGTAPGSHGHVGILKATLFTVDYANGPKPWRLWTSLPGWTGLQTKHQFATEADAQAFAEKVLARFIEKLLAEPEKETES